MSRSARLFLSVYMGLVAGLFLAFYLGKRATRNLAGPQVEIWRELTDEELLA